MAAGLPPQLDIALAPTPKPAVIASGLTLPPVGHAAIPITVFLAFQALGGLALAAFLLAA